MSRGLILTLALMGLFLAPQVSALTINSQDTFATVQEGDVSWRTDGPMVVSSMTIKPRSLVVDGLDYNFTPASAPIVVVVNHWTADKRVWNITHSSATSITFVWTNPGDNYTLSRNGTVISTCVRTTSVCWWNISSSSPHQLKLTAPGVDGICGCPGQEGGGESPPAEPAGGGGGGGGFSGLDNALNQLGQVLPPLPSPIERFPQFNAIQWGSIIIGLALTLSGMPQTRRTLPKWLQLPGNPTALLLSGVVVLTLVYLFTPRM